MPVLDHVVVEFLVAPPHYNPALAEGVAVHDGVELVHEHRALREGLLLVLEVLAWDFDVATVKFGQEWAQFLQIEGLLLLVYLADQMVAEISDFEKDFRSALLHGLLVDELGVPDWSKGLEDLGHRSLGVLSKVEVVDVL